MTPLLWLLGLLAVGPAAAGPIITTLVEARSGDDTCTSASSGRSSAITIRSCDAHSEEDGSVSVSAFVGDNFLGVGAGFDVSGAGGPMFAHSFASIEDEILPLVDGYAIFRFEFFGASDTSPAVSARFNQFGLGLFEENRFKVPVQAGVPYPYIIELEASDSLRTVPGT